MAVKSAVIAVDAVLDGTCAGRILEDGNRPLLPFQDINQAALALEQACSEDKSPFPSVKRRHFADGQTGPSRAVPAMKKRRIPMSELKEMAPRGDLGTFLVCVQHRENGSWQGHVTWMENNRTVKFRSVWEMVQLVDEAIRGGMKPEVSWE